MTNSSIVGAYSFLMEKLDVGICAIDTYGEVVIYNKKIQSLYGKSKVEYMQSLKVQNLNPKFNENLLLKVLNSQKEIKNVKHTFWNKNDEEVSIISDYYYLNLENYNIAVQISRDITQQEFLMDKPLFRYGQPLTFETITAVSKSMKAVIEQAKIAALGRMSVMIIGESGTGKDMIAEGIHHALEDKNERFIVLICRRNEDALLEQIEEYISKNYNYTFYAERVEHLSMHAQERIVDLLEEYKERNHLFIASIGEDPIDLIQNIILSKNLYYIFSKITIHVPALRERPEDIQPFIDDYFERRRNNYGLQVHKLTSEVSDLFINYKWPGNLKELEVLLDDICTVITSEEIIDVSFLPAYFKWKMASVEELNPIIPNNEKLEPLDKYLRKVEEYYIDHALKINDGNISKTAKTLGIHRQGLQYRLKRK